MTFSVAGFCPDTGMLGCAITSSSIGVASRCAWVDSGTGVALTQNVTNPALGSLGLKLLREGLAPAQVLKAQACADTDVQWRQLGLVNARGETATFSGTRALGIHATAEGRHCLAMGNLLANAAVPQAMIGAFESSRGHLADRLLQALEAGLAAGGEMGPVYSAGLKICAEPSWPVVDLRVDWREQPILELRSLWTRYAPQMQAYITRASTPSDAESFGVPGDE
ncbi:DUF1028 domain-containing protein [Marinobacterium sedimentorum]|uniref:DUF1028 domain-containing protein n=1 Tax=Marinobacterium sedimentorum TaxID=2927804 RepID=UPI0020C6B389|nr:DUF1028 domain-containing protein [Marinobacterium sedimentorum]MCP8686765.1 DUF1028 domain-containing protein [Marinobacterium sedimentorum]